MRPTHPKVSVIVAVFNQEKFIGRCLRSLLNQSMNSSDYEIIVVDDGSTDRTPYALELFHGSITTITNYRNLGLPAALNVGIKQTSSEYIIRVDSDDFVNANFLNFLATYLDLNTNSHAVACDYHLVNDSGEWIERVNCFDTPIACGIMFKAAHLFEIGLYDEKFRYHEDKDLRFRFEQKYTIDRLDIPLYRYRRHSDNITNNSSAMSHHQKKLIDKHGHQILDSIV